MRDSNSSSGRARYALGAIAACSIVAAVPMFGSLSDRTWVQPELLFSMVTVTAAVSMIAATVLMALADRRNTAEIGLLGAMLMAAAVFQLVHGLVTPGVLFDLDNAFRTSAFLTMPVAIAVGAPLLMPHSAFGRWAARRWRDWTLLSILGVFVAATMIAFFPGLIVSADPTSPIAIGLTVVVMLAVVRLSLRQMRFYELGQRTANLVASISLALFAVMACAPLSSEPYGLAFWWVHVAGALGLIGACAGLAATRGMSPSAHDVLGPILTRDPLVAFELGLSPIVHEFVADLEAKDAITRDHVARTAELAMRIGERFRLSPTDLRDLGLAALLHDVGKVNVPDSILKKPARLTDDEYELMKLHPVDGAAMLASEPTLSAASKIVRSHHERFDGRGYPDGLTGREIPLGSRIIAVCDAFDAMTHDRQYRNAMPAEMAFAILREHAGSQWDEQVVGHVVMTVSTTPSLRAFDDVGRAHGVDLPTSIPDDVRELLVSVDAEI